MMSAQTNPAIVVAALGRICRALHDKETIVLTQTEAVHLAMANHQGGGVVVVDGVTYLLGDLDYVVLPDRIRTTEDESETR